MEDHRALLERVFGESSDGEEAVKERDEVNSSRNGAGSPSTSLGNPTWEPIKEIKGLWMCRDFLSPLHQSTLLSAILNEGWFVEACNNQAMRFGDLPSWAVELSRLIHEVVLFGECIYESAENSDAFLPMPSEIIWREPLFNQLIVNVYQPGEGICAHVDLMRFEDGIAIVSLESACIMHFSQVGEACNAEEGQKNQAVAKIPVLLSPGSLIVMSGEARYLWKHEINRKPGFQVWEGQELSQKRRISITMRKLCCGD